MDKELMVVVEGSSTVEGHPPVSLATGRLTRILVLLSTNTQTWLQSKGRQPLISVHEKEKALDFIKLCSLHLPQCPAWRDMTQ